MKLLNLIVITLFACTSMASDTVYDGVLEWHNSRIKNVLKINSAQNDVDYAIDLQQVVDANQEDKKIKLPGLLLSNKKENKDLDLIQNSYELFQRKLTLINLTGIDQSQMDKISSEITSSLKFGDKDSINIVKGIRGTASEGSGSIVVDFKDGLYDTFIKKSLLFWLVLMLGIAYFALNMMKKSILEIADLISKTWSNQGGPHGGAFENSSQDNKDEDLKKEILDEPFLNEEGLNAEAFISNFSFFIENYPGYLLNIIFTHFKHYEQMARLFVDIDQLDVSASSLPKKEKALKFIKTYVFENAHRTKAKLAADGHSLNEFSKLISLLKIANLNSKIENVYFTVYSKHGMNYSEVLREALASHFEVTYLVFEEISKTILEKNSELLFKNAVVLNNLFSASKAVDDLHDIEIQKAVHFISNYKSDLNQVQRNTVSVLFYGLTDVELNELDIDKDSLIFKGIPKISWISAKDRSVFKSFLSELDNDELKILAQSINGFSEILKVFDGRFVYRMNERLNSESNLTSQSWFKLRQHIEKYYADNTQKNKVEDPHENTSFQNEYNTNLTESSSDPDDKAS